MSKDSSAKYYQDNTERLQEKTQKTSKSLYRRKKQQYGPVR